MKYVSDSYQQYLNSSHWREMRQRHITNNKRARCCISGEKHYLCLHHEDYRNKYNEQLNKDVFIVTEKIHRRIHFMLFGLIRVPLTPNWLKFRRLYLKLRFSLSRKLTP